MFIKFIGKSINLSIWCLKSKNKAYHFENELEKMRVGGSGE